ncbi:sulfotransferase domain protein [bacterium BMS3Abin13]|nr:sulfotransferase domain protein [bacterium BMS3Abin13]
MNKGVKSLAGREGKIRPIIIATHERSGTHLTIDTFRRQFLECNSWKCPGEPLDRLYLSLESVMQRGGTEERMVRSILGRCRRPLIKYHNCSPEFNDASLQDVPWLQEVLSTSEIVYVCRDGRAVMCSWFEYVNKNFGAGWHSIGELLRQKRQGMSLPKYWACHVQNWLARPGVIVLRVEDLLLYPEQKIFDMGWKLDLTVRGRMPLLPSNRHFGWMNAFARFFCVRPQCTAIIPGLFRRAKSPKWQDVFTPDDRSFFHAEAGDVLVQLGYAKSEKWVDEYQQFPARL